MKRTKKKTKKKMLISFCITFILIMSVSAFIGATTTIKNPTTVTFKDENLYNKVIECFSDKDNRINYNSNDEDLTIELSKDDLTKITELDLHGVDGLKISDITGLEMFTHLEKLNLTNNTIRDITPISDLENIISIDLSNNAYLKIYDKQTEECYIPNKANIEELNIESTNNSNLSFISQLPNLKILNASKNGIANTSPLKTLNKIKKLNLSSNTSIVEIDDILSLHSLKDLNISLTGITSLLHSKNTDSGIFNLMGLENLNVEGNKLSSIDPILKTYVEVTTEDSKEIKTTKAYLENLKQLNINYTGQNSINYTNLILLKNLTHLSMKGNKISNLNNNITELKNLEYINLSDNLITNISAFEKRISLPKEEWTYDEQGNRIDYKYQYLTATKIELAHNKITDISLLEFLGHDITYLDLSENSIYDVTLIDSGLFTFSEGLKLQRQGCGWDTPIYYMPIKDKKASVDQHIILPTLFQHSKREGSRVYSKNASFTTYNIKMNDEEKYQAPGLYNVIIGYDKTSKDELKVTLNGGCADGSTLYFKISGDQNSIDSAVFNDPNLIAAINKEISESTKALNIINVKSYVFTGITKLDLKAGEIKDITGLASFENLAYLYLQDNNITSINELKENTVMMELYLANNLNLKDVTAIENMVKLTKLDLANIGLDNLISINNMIQNMYKKNKSSYPIKYLNISDNNVGGIDGIEVLKSLEELDISNINIKDISKLSSLINLRTLHASGNRIEDLEDLRGLKNLKYLHINGNKNITNIEPISQISLSTLDFSDNRVKDITSLTQSYSELKMDSNLISDISCFNNMRFEEFSIENQKLTHTVKQEETGDITIELPQLLQLSKQEGSKVYTEKNYILTNCQLTEDQKSVVVNVEELKNHKIATVKITGGNANSTTFSIAEPLEGTITYEPSNEIPTNKDITASITFNRKNVTITNNDGKDTYLFTENGEFTFEYMDENGFEGVTVATVTNIDKLPPQGAVSQEVINKQVVATISLNEPIVTIEGWTPSGDGLSITKTYSADTSETITLTDLVGNTSSVEVSVKIDITPPTITGVENGILYGTAVTPLIEDETLNEIKLLKDGVEVADFESGTSIMESGKYTLTAIDKFENETTINFEIDVSGVIISKADKIIITENETVGEETKPIIRITTPKTTLSQLKENIKSEMTYSILNTEGKVITSSKTQIGTGYQIKMKSGKIYTIIVMGDLNGNGEISLSEVVQSAKVAVGITTQVEELKFKAMDITGNGKVNVSDVAAIAKLKIK